MLASGKVSAFKEIDASLPILDLSTRSWAPASLSCSSVKLAKGLMQGLRQKQDFGAIAKDENLNVTFLYQLAIFALAG